MWVDLCTLAPLRCNLAPLSKQSKTPEAQSCALKQAIIFVHTCAPKVQTCAPKQAMKKTKGATLRPLQGTQQTLTKHNKNKGFSNCDYTSTQKHKENVCFSIGGLISDCPGSARPVQPGHFLRTSNGFLTKTWFEASKCQYFAWRAAKVEGLGRLRKVALKVWFCIN